MTTLPIPRPTTQDPTAGPFAFPRVIGSSVFAERLAPVHGRSSTSLHYQYRSPPDPVVRARRAYIVGPVTPWARQPVQDLVQLADLQPDWDHAGAAPVDLGVIEAAANFVNATLVPQSPRPAVVPTHSGGVQIEWHTRGVDLELEFVSATEILYFFEDQAAGRPQEGTAKDDWTIPGRLVHSLALR